MLLYIGKRLLQAIPTLILVAVGVFLLIHLLPGDPVSALAGPDATQQDIADAKARYGLNRPLYVQFVNWIGGMLHGDFGRSYVTGRSVAAMILTAAPVTLTLAVMATLVCLIVGVPSAIGAGLHKGRIADRAILGGSLVGISLPTFVMGIVLILIFSVGLEWFPSSGYVPFTTDPVASVQSYTLPAVSLGLLYAANIARTGRAATLEVLSEDFVTTVRAVGLSEFSTRYRHILRNALNPILSVVGVTLGGLLGGTVVTEKVFNLPGVGTLIVNSITSRDYPVIQATVVLITVIYLVINLIVDILYGVADPRIQHA